MNQSYRLKSLGARDLEAALAKAEQYRALNEPEEAESICRDILAVSSDHQLALRTLGLALTDRFDKNWTSCFDESLTVFKKLKSEYEVVYYSGVAWERCAKAQLENGQVRNAAHSFERALEQFESAEKISPTVVKSLSATSCGAVVISRSDGSDVFARRGAASPGAMYACS